MVLSYLAFVKLPTCPATACEQRVVPTYAIPHGATAAALSAHDSPILCFLASVPFIDLHKLTASCYAAAGDEFGPVL